MSKTSDLEGDISGIEIFLDAFGASSRPKPDCLIPSNGAAGSEIATRHPNGFLREAKEVFRAIGDLAKGFSQWLNHFNGHCAGKIVSASGDFVKNRLQNL